MSLLQRPVYSTAYDRATHLRGQADMLRVQSGARLLLLWKGQVLARQGANGQSALAWLGPEMSGIAPDDGDIVFLGLFENAPIFCADISHHSPDAITRLVPGDAVFQELRSIAAQLAPETATIAATAKSMLNWHRHQRFCGCCGQRSVPRQGGWVRLCPHCDSLHFPRIDPVVIMLVVHGDRVLLGRQATWPPGLYSLLAGFMEPGETLAAAVEREVMEETGVRIGSVRYLDCQPWPFNTNLMLGCLANAQSTDLRIDSHELEDALWLDRSEMKTIMDGRHPRLVPPRPDAIAQAILSDWIHDAIREC